MNTVIRSAAGKVMWVGRATVFLVGLAVILALVVGVASAAFGANGQAWILGQSNVATAITRLAGAAGVNGPMLAITNNNPDANDTALALNVQAGEAPMRVNSDTRVANLNSTRAGRADSAASADFAIDAHNAANADMLGGKDIDELPGTMVQTAGIVGAVETTPSFGTLAFYGPTAEVTTSSTQRLVGVISVPLKVVESNNTGNSLEFTYGLCYRAAGTTNTPAPFYGGTNEARGTATTTPVSWTAAQTKVPGLANTWDVGFCARNGSNNFQTLSGAGSASGWIGVVN